MLWLFYVVPMINITHPTIQDDNIFKDDAKLFLRSVGQWISANNLLRDMWVVAVFFIYLKFKSVACTCCVTSVYHWRILLSHNFIGKFWRRSVCFRYKCDFFRKLICNYLKWNRGTVVTGNYAYSAVIFNFGNNTIVAKLYNWKSNRTRGRKSEWRSHQNKWH